MRKILYKTIFITLLILSSCKKDVDGCMNSSAINYNSIATVDDNSCFFDSDGDGIYYTNEIFGCIDSLAENFDSTANTDDNSCIYLGCMDEMADNYNPQANQENGNCIYYGCMILEACNYNEQANTDDGSCEYAQEGYDCEGNFTEYVLGMQAEGGIIFYLDESGDHGLVAALEDLGEYEWGCSGEYVDGADDISIGTGFQNTMDIVNQECSTENGGITSALAALTAEINGYSDWYLPSKDELVEMYNTIGNGGSQGNIGDFSSSWYWSSSEYSINLAIFVYFGNGNSYDYDKNGSNKVRAIRTF